MSRTREQEKKVANSMSVAADGGSGRLFVTLKLVQLIVLNLALFVYFVPPTLSAGFNDFPTTHANYDALKQINNQEAASIDDRFSTSENFKTLTRFKRIIERRRQTTLANKTLLPEFGAPIGNVSAVLGRDVRLVCTVDNLGSYQVAWLKEETRTILSIDTNIIITNYRIFLIPDEEQRKWVLHIKDVQESDRGFYQCQVNTKPMRSTSGYLEVVVPPQIVESQSSQVVEVIEHANASIQCKASGHPKPTITWRRDDGFPIKLAGVVDSTSSLINGENSESWTQSDTVQFSRFNEIKSDKLTLVNVDRSMGGQYVCTASNGIPSQASKTIPLYVKFAPKVQVTSRYVAASLGDQLELDCLIESFPRAETYWTKQAPNRFNLIHNERRQWTSNAVRLQTSNDSMLAHTRRRAWRPPGAERATFRASGRMLPAASRHKPERAPFTSSNSAASMRSARAMMTQDDELKSEVDEQQQPDSSNQGQDDAGEQLAEYDGEHESSTTMKNNHSKSSQTFSLKHIPLNPYTYKLKLIIAEMKASDYGEYVCHSSNSLGTSETRVIVTHADDKLIAEKHPAVPSAKSRSLDSNEFQHDTTKSDYVQSGSRTTTQQRTGVWPSANRVYDENYLQAIKNRKSQGANLASPSSVSVGKLQQSKYKLQAAENNGQSMAIIMLRWPLLFSATIPITSLIALNCLGLFGAPLQL